MPNCHASGSLCSNYTCKCTLRYALCSIYLYYEYMCTFISIKHSTEVSKWFLPRKGKVDSTQSFSIPPFFFFFFSPIFEYPSGWHRLWLLHISSIHQPMSLVGEGERCEGGQDEDQSGTISSQALILEMKLLSYNTTALLFWTVNPLANTSSPPTPPTSLTPLSAEVWLQRASLSYHIKKHVLPSTFPHSYRNPEGI